MGPDEHQALELYFILWAEAAGEGCNVGRAERNSDLGPLISNQDELRGKSLE